MKILYAISNEKKISDESALQYLNLTNNQKILYESIRTYYDPNAGIHIPFELEAHLQRLEMSIEILQLELTLSIQEVSQKFREGLAHAVKLHSLSAEDIVFVKIICSEKEVVFIYRQIEIDPVVYVGVKALLYYGERILPEHKTLSLSVQKNARQYLQEKNAYEALLVDSNGIIREGAYSSLFWIKNDQLYTSSFGVLPGVTQAVVQQFGSCKSGFLRKEDLTEIDALFITQTTRGIVPVLQVDDVCIASGEVHPLLVLLQQCFYDYILEYNRQYLLRYDI